MNDKAVHEKTVLQRMEYELMLFSRYYLRPHHNAEKVLDRSAVILLSRLESAVPMTLKELAAALRLDGSTVHRQVAALLRSGLVGYAPNDGGQVARRIEPTSAGRDALRESRRIYARGIEQVIGDWPEEKREQFLGLLMDFNHEVERIEGSHWPRSRTKK